MSLHLPKWLPLVAAQPLGFVACKAEASAAVEPRVAAAVVEATS